MECDHGSGVEKYLGKTSCLVDDIEHCKRTCEADINCRSVTLFKGSGWCSHFSTECKKTKSIHSDAISMRFDRTKSPATTAPVTTRSAPTTARQGERVFYNKEQTQFVQFSKNVQQKIVEHACLSVCLSVCVRLSWRYMYDRSIFTA